MNQCHLLGALAARRKERRPANSLCWTSHIVDLKPETALAKTVSPHLSATQDIWGTPHSV